MTRQRREYRLGLIRGVRWQCRQHMEGSKGFEKWTDATEGSGSICFEAWATIAVRRGEGSSNLADGMRP